MMKMWKMKPELNLKVLRTIVASTLISLTSLVSISEATNEPEKNTIESLRTAIHFLTNTYGKDYPEGKAYLERLDGISDPASKSYQQLQREALLSHPHIKGYNWLIEVRDQYWGNHGPINTMFQNGDLNKNDKGGYKNWSSIGGWLEVISIQDNGEIVRKIKLSESSQGILRDADISFDGKKILFSMRKTKKDDYHIYEMDIDGSNLKQLTFGKMISDVDPIYMPDGSIIFSSTRDPKFCQCNRHISLNMFKMEADGANIVQISKNALADFHSSLLSDGRVIYSRWEYVDRHFGPSLGLWTSNPDGTRHTLFMGNNAWSPGSIVDARAIPGTDKILAIYGAAHDLPWGAMVVLDRSQGLEGNAPITQMWPQSGRQLVAPDDDEYNQNLKYRRDVDKMRNLTTRYEDPYPVHDLKHGTNGGHFFLSSKVSGEFHHSYTRKNMGKMVITLTDVFGNELTVYEIKGSKHGAFGAIPIAPRKKPPMIPDIVDYTKKEGYLYVNDVYLGDKKEMDAVKRGEIKYLRIIDAPARRTYDERGVWNVDAQQVTAMNWNLTNNKRILGDVPVEEDGSAFFKVPADIFLQIHALDENKQMIQAMRSGTIIRPGETQGCIGCHENRLSAPVPTNQMPIAMRRAPSEIDPWMNTPSVDEAKPFNYLTEVQPIWDKHCISCHDYDGEAGEVLNLAGDLSFPFNVSYHELMTKSGIRYTGVNEKMVNFVGDGPPGVLPAYAWGSHRSKLVRILKEGHSDVKLSKEEMQRITSWIDVNAVYYGPYQSFYPGRNPIKALENGGYKNKMVLGELDNMRNCKDYVMKNGHLLNFTRPEKSPALALIEDETKRAEALFYIKEASELLKKHQREDQTNSEQPFSTADQYNSKRFESTENENMKSIKAILSGQKYFQYKSND